MSPDWMYLEYPVNFQKCLIMLLNVPWMKFECISDYPDIPWYFYSDYPFDHPEYPGDYPYHPG